MPVSHVAQALSIPAARVLRPRAIWKESPNRPGTPVRRLVIEATFTV